MKDRYEDQFPGVDPNHTPFPFNPKDMMKNSAPGWFPNPPSETANTASSTPPNLQKKFEDVTGTIGAGARKEDIFDKAKAVTLESREEEYGHPLINFMRIALRWSNWLGVKVTPVDVAFMMMDTKLARENHVHKEDNVVDIVGYASCYERIDNYMRDRLDYEAGAKAFEKMTVSDMQSLYMELLHPAIPAQY